MDKDDVEIYETSCNRVVVMEIVSEKKPNIVFVPEGLVKEIIDPLLINKMFELDFNENLNMSPTYSSIDDETFLRKVDGIRLRTDGHYEIPLPFNDDKIKLPNNKGSAASRLKQLKSRFVNDEGYKKDYVAFMNQMIMKGYAERVPTSEDGRRQMLVYSSSRRISSKKAEENSCCFRLLLSVQGRVS